MKKEKNKTNKKTKLQLEEHFIIIAKQLYNINILRLYNNIVNCEKKDTTQEKSIVYHKGEHKEKRKQTKQKTKKEENKKAHSTKLRHESIARTKKMYKRLRFFFIVRLYIYFRGDKKWMKKKTWKHSKDTYV